MRLSKGNIRSLLFSTISSLTLIGCGGGDSSSSTSNVEETPRITTTFSGKVIDGYLVGAKVCLDINKNYKCDEDEPFTISKENGDYTFKNVTETELTNYNLIAEVNENVIDEDDGKKINGIYTLITSPNEPNITPLSTIATKYTKNGGDLKYLAQWFDIEDTSLFNTDYIKNGNDELHNKAKIIANIKMGIRSKIKNELNDVDNEYIEDYINNSTINMVYNIKEEIEINGYNPTLITDNLLKKINTDNFKQSFNSYKNILKYDASFLNEPTSNSVIEIGNIDYSNDNLRYNLKQGQHYRISSNEIEKSFYFFIDDSDNKTCAIKALKDTNISSDYSITYKINDSFTLIDYNKTYVLNSDNKIDIKLYNGVNKGTHLDFFVDCYDYTWLDETLAYYSAKTGLNIPSFSKISIRSQKVNIISDDDNQKVTEYDYIYSYDNYYGRDLSNYDYSGFAIYHSDIPIVSFERDSIKLEDVKKIIITHDKKNRKVNIIIKSDSTELYNNTIILPPINKSTLVRYIGVGLFVKTGTTLNHLMSEINYNRSQTSNIPGM